MDYVYLPIQSGFRIRKSTMISVLNDIIAAENGNVDMREIANCQSSRSRAASPGVPRRICVMPYPPLFQTDIPPALSQ